MPIEVEKEEKKKKTEKGRDMRQVGVGRTEDCGSWRVGECGLIAKGSRTHRDADSRDLCIREKVGLKIGGLWRTTSLHSSQ